MQIDRDELAEFLSQEVYGKLGKERWALQLADALIHRFSDIYTNAAVPALRSSSEILLAGADAIDQRAEQRDAENGERSMAKAIDAFNALTGHNVSAREGWEFMAILKLARANGGRFHVDDYVDGAAYMALAGESVIRGE